MKQLKEEEERCGDKVRGWEEVEEEEEEERGVLSGWGRRGDPIYITDCVM